MKKFSFSLQFLLDYRKRREDLIKKEYARMIAKEEEERQILAKLQEELLCCQKWLEKEKEKESISAPTASLYYSYIGKLIDQIRERTRKVKKISREREKAHKDFLRAAQDRKIVERIKEKKLEQFLEHERKMEQEIIDESAIGKFYRRTTG